MPRYGNEKIKTLIELRIGSDTKILSFSPLLTAIKDSKKFRQGIFRFRIADLKETIVEVNVGQHKRKIIYINVYYKCY